MVNSYVQLRYNYLTLFSGMVRWLSEFQSLVLSCYGCYLVVSVVLCCVDLCYVVLCCVVLCYTAIRL